jgi:hypothetical protein
MAILHTGYGSDGRALASVPRNGSDCGSGCRTLTLCADVWDTFALGTVSAITNDKPLLNVLSGLLF